MTVNRSEFIRYSGYAGLFALSATALAACGRSSPPVEPNLTLTPVTPETMDQEARRIVNQITEPSIKQIYTASTQPYQEMFTLPLGIGLAPPPAGIEGLFKFDAPRLSDQPRFRIHDAQSGMSQEVHTITSQKAHIDLPVEWFKNLSDIHKRLVLTRHATHLVGWGHFRNFATQLFRQNGGSTDLIDPTVTSEEIANILGRLQLADSKSGALLEYSTYLAVLGQIAEVKTKGTVREQNQLVSMRVSNTVYEAARQNPSFKTWRSLDITGQAFYETAYGDLNGKSEWLTMLQKNNLL